MSESHKRTYDDTSARGEFSGADSDHVNADYGSNPVPPLDVALRVQSAAEHLLEAAEAEVPCEGGVGESLRLPANGLDA